MGICSDAYFTMFCLVFVCIGADSYVRWPDTAPAKICSCVGVTALCVIATPVWTSFVVVGVCGLASCFLAAITQVIGFALGISAAFALSGLQRAMRKMAL